VYYSSVFIEYLDVRADLVPAEGIISGDRYSFIRSLYLQRREFLINDGQVKDEFDDFDEFEEDF
jgi:phospholipid-binding lipoprotein MlaA